MRFMLTGCLLSMLTAPLPAGAHHSTAMFDKAKEVVVSGTVTEFQWTNPHSWIEMDVKSEAGAVVHYSIELGAPRSMQRNGWKVRSLKSGDKVTLTVHPFKNGKPGGLLLRATLPDGRVLEYTRT